MKTGRNIFIALILTTAFGSADPISLNHAPGYKELVEPFLLDYCYDCHGSETQKGNLSFEGLSDVTEENSELWKSMWEQIALQEMPPRDEKFQPTLKERLELSHWMTKRLNTQLADVGGFHQHLHPAKANHLPHDLLFGEIPEDLTPPSTPARLWRVTPQEHLVRLNSLINIDPAYDPEKPGIRTQGDHVPWNRLGEVKVYFGLDQIKGWLGGTAAYAAAITGFPPALSEVTSHGLRNYPILYSINGSEASQIASQAEDILHYMAYGPDIEPYQLGTKGELPEKYQGNDMRGTTQSLYYHEEIKRPKTPLFDLAADDELSQFHLKRSIEFLFEALTLRPPNQRETANYVKLANQTIQEIGKKEGIVLGLIPIFLDRDALYRPELASDGRPDKYNRVFLKDWELALAINGALSYLGPDEPLKQAVIEGQLNSREEVRKQVERILSDHSIRKPRILQFFREYFDYDLAGTICKDDKAAKEAAKGLAMRNHLSHMFMMTAHTDRIVELVIEEDKHVLRELLTTRRAVIRQGIDPVYYSQFENLKLSRTKKDNDDRKPARHILTGQTQLVTEGNIHVRVAEVDEYRDDGKRHLTTLPENQRMGILTHPSWLVSHSDAMDNHAIHRGKWIRERLLGDAVPDVPITVDAQLPDEPGTTLRHRMRVTSENECWRCHKKMDPLGLPFEMYNHLGLYRTTEHGKPVNTSGEIIQSGDPKIDGSVTDALDLIERLANSEHVEQVFVRHAFRYWIGRNETIADAPILQDAWKAYRDNNGSLKALITSLLTSDAFLYRTRE